MSVVKPEKTFTWNRSAAVAFAAPFVVFMLLLEVGKTFRIENSELPWWRQYPEQWVYPLQAIVCLGLILLFRRQYPKWSTQGFGLAIGAGVSGIVLWLIPPILHAWTGIGGEGSWLRFLGFRPRLEGFDPYLFGDSLGEWPVLVTVVLRFLRLVVVVALVEEIFWRGFLMRWIQTQGADWSKLTLEKCGWLSVLATAGAFALAHAGPDTLVALLYGLLAGWVAIRTGNLWAVVIMHATANLALGIFIMGTEWWGLW
jgi:hypothetical protein